MTEDRQQGPDSDPTPKKTVATLEAITKSLQANPNVSYAGEIRYPQHCSPEGDPLDTDIKYGGGDMTVEKVKIIIAPKHSRLAEGRLNKFIEGLVVPSIEGGSPTYIR